MRTNQYLYKETTGRENKSSENENLQEINFVELVKQMRHYQRRYHATRSPVILLECKKLEEAVDKYINKKNDAQLKLF